MAYDLSERLLSLNALNPGNPHIFFDDQESHFSATSNTLPSVHVPFGQLNQGVGA